MNQHERCECHECTQARWRMSIQWQIGYSFVAQAPFYSTPAAGPIVDDPKRKVGEGHEHQ